MIPESVEPMEAESRRPAPSAAEVVTAYRVEENPHPASAQERAKVLASPGFGVYFSDHMGRATWTAEDGWGDYRVVPYGPTALDPAGAVLHYGQEVFEGLKVYRHEDGSLWTFRPTYNALRMNYSSGRLAIPEFPVEAFLGSITALTRQDAAWVPDKPGSLYLRPFVFASESFLGVRSAQRFEYFLIASPSGAYFPNGFQPINLWVERDYHRAGPGGMGAAKRGGNYTASLLPKLRAAREGYDEVLFLDAATATTIDELGGMNVFVVYRDGRLRTPRLTGNILPGNTRSSILQLAHDAGVDAAEETLVFDDVVADIRSGAISEMFACGTAAVVTSIGSLSGTDANGQEFRLELKDSTVAKRVYDTLTGIQYGTIADPYNWMYRID